MTTNFQISPICSWFNDLKHPVLIVISFVPDYDYEYASPQKTKNQISSKNVKLRTVKLHHSIKSSY